MCLPVTEESSHSRIVCKQCNKHCCDYETMQKRLNALKLEICHSYNNTIASEYNECTESLVMSEDSNSSKIQTEIMHAVPQHESETSTQINNSTNIISFTGGTNTVQEFLIHGKKVVLLKKGTLTTNRFKKKQLPDQPSEQPPEILVATQENLNTEEGGEPEYDDSQEELAVVDTTIVEEEGSDFLVTQTIDQEYFDETDATNMVEISTEADDNFDFLDSNSGTDENHHIDYESIPMQIKTELMHDFKDNYSTVDGVPGCLGNVKLEKADSNVHNDLTMKPIFMRDGSKFMCQLCPNAGETSYDARTIAGHLKSEHDERVYICDLCGNDFRKRNELSEHLEEHVFTTDDGTEYACDVCKRVFNNLKLFRIHKRMHYTTVKSWTCRDCNKKYSSRNLLDEHMNMHTGARPYKCQHCSKDFASKYTLTAHTKIHTERKRPHECKVCSKSFYSHQNLAQHERTHSGVKEYVCNVCDKAFGTAHNLDVHKIVHTGYKPFICRKCGKAFARRAEIKDHERTHTGERPYNCELCGASFAQRSNLMSHKRATHLNDKRYKCDQCEKSFKRRRLLDYHKKATHTGERPYKCLTCASTFVYPEHYKKHLRIHSGDKPFKCEVCGKAFNSRDNRNAHRFVHSDKKPYECLECGVGFMRKPLLLAHMKAQNHENERIVLNQPRITTTDNVKSSVIESNVVYANNENIFELTDDVSYKIHFFLMFILFLNFFR